MKKILSMVLAVMLVLSMAACNGNNAGSTTTTAEPTTTAPAVEVPESALEVLESVWNLFGDNEKFPVIGGDYENMVDSAPGAVKSNDFLVGTLLIPEAEASKVTDAASLVHGMMLNNFTSGAYRINGDAAAFADTMHGVISNNPWICGMPEKMVIAVVGGEYVVAVFGVNDAVNPFEAKLTEAYPDAVIKYSEAITG